MLLCLRTVALGVATAFSVALLAPGAWAQGAAPQAAAQALFEEGRRLMAAGEFAQACPKFAESQKLDPGAGTLVNLAACYERQGQTASAWVTYTEAKAAAERSGRKDWAGKAADKAAAIYPSLSKLSILVPATSQTPDLEVKRDGVVVGRGEWGVAIPVDPGPHVVEASAPGRQRWSNTVQVGSVSDQIAVTVPPLEGASGKATQVSSDAPPVPTTAPPAEGAAPGNTQRTAAWIVGGVGLVGLGLGAWFGVSALSKRSDAEGHCDPGFGACDAQGVELLDGARNAATLSTVGFIVGGIATAGAVVLFVTAPKAQEPMTGRKLYLTAGPSMGPGLGVGGSF